MPYIHSNQIERTLPNGVKHITYPNKNYRIIYPDGSEELTTADGTILRIGSDGTEVVILPNGEREIRSREYTVIHLLQSFETVSPAFISTHNRDTSIGTGS